MAVSQEQFLSLKPFAKFTVVGDNSTFYVNGRNIYQSNFDDDFVAFIEEITKFHLFAATFLLGQKVSVIIRLKDINLVNHHAPGN
jgi:hypothetical protein